MKKLSTYFSTEIISLLSIPIYREGNVIYMPHVTLEVVNACSGLNAVISVLAIGTFWGYLVFNNYFKRAAFFALLIPIAIVSNIVRIVSTALISNYLTVDITRNLLHEFSGTVLVMVVAFTLILFSSKILK